MERQSRSKSFGNVRDNDLKTNIESTAIDNVKIKRARLSSSIKQYLTDYTTNSNLHGLKYIGEKERTLVEKIFWLIMFTCCVVCCALLIRKVWEKWNYSPVIVSFAESSTPVFKIPYPAVTLCPETNVMQTVFNYTKYSHLYVNNFEKQNITLEEARLVEDVSLICWKNHYAPLNGRNFSHGNETVENIKKISPKIEDVMVDVSIWKSKYLSLSSFLPILTEEGYCYTFNTIDADQLLRVENLNTDYNYLEPSNKSHTWTLENGYSPKTPLETYPHRGPGHGENTGLILILKVTNQDCDFLCSGPTQGFKILLHSPAEFPRLSQQFFRVPLGRDISVAVTPKMMTTSEGLSNYSAFRRQCYFPYERYLKYFKVYTQTNCETECLTNFTYAKCGCVHFAMPLELITIEIQNELDDTMHADDIKREALRVAINCQCLPSCTSIDYGEEISQGNFNVEAVANAYNLSFNKEKQGDSYTQVKIYFKEAQFIKVQRSELYGQTDFLANCGGLLGLFLGFSILSVVEILYFLTLRIYCLCWSSRQNKKCNYLKKDIE
ncbi:unnamed protein product [Euphydryas editha]|uniref:Uncharacterized protein n=1 Tax=Euphydryas editha TaxID=104508 RepID=A0AAU9V607_EUPED|nr:unnamed protein product [Euphydryas editha]